MKRTIIIALIAVTGFSCGNSNKSGRDSFETKLDDFINVLYQNNKFMGSVSLSKNGTVIYSKSIGFADIEREIKATAATRYRIGSISKMITASMVFKAAEEGKLDINQSIENYFPDIENAKHIIVGDLLNHRSGIPSFTKDKTFFEYHTEHKSREEMIRLISDYPSNFDPGSMNEYSNSNYYLLSIILEKVYDTSFSELIINKISTPLELQNTYYGGDIKLESNESNSYTLSSTWVKETATHLSIPMGGGSILSTPADLNTFIEALFDEQIISKASIDQMTNIKDNYGMGILPFSHANKNGFGHGGHIDGFHAISIYFPDEKLAISITANALDYNINTMLTSILKCYFNESFEVPAFEQVEITSGELEKYVGIYTGEGPGVFTITRKNNTLYAQLNDGPNDPLKYLGNHTFTNEEVGANFRFDPTKNQLGLEQSGVADTYSFTKNSQ